MAARSKAWVCGRSLAEIVGSNPTGGMDVCLMWVLCVLSGTGLCDELITRAEESYRLWCVVVCDLETSWRRRSWATGGVGGLLRQKTKTNSIHPFDGGIIFFGGGRGQEKVHGPRFHKHASEWEVLRHKPWHVIHNLNSVTRYFNSITCFSGHASFSSSDTN